MTANPVGLIVAAVAAAGIAVWHFRDEIVGAFGAVLRFVIPWVDRYLSLMAKACMGGFQSLGRTSTIAREKLAGLAESSKDWGKETEEAGTP